MNMKLIEDYEQFDAMREAFLRELARAVRLGLGETGIDPEQAFQATEKILFNIAVLIDGSAPIILDGGKIEPFLTFKQDNDNLIFDGGSSMYEMAFNVALEVCGDIDEEAENSN